MKKFLLSITLVLSVALFFGCSKGKEEKKAETKGTETVAEKPMMPAEHPAMGGEAAAPHAAGEKSTRQVVVPDDVKARYKSVDLKVSDGTKEHEVKAEIGKKIAVPGTDLSVMVEAFLPDYTIDTDSITSKSAEPNNPAVLVELYEKDNAVAKGWVFERLADFNSYRHEKYQIVLEPVAGEAKGGHK